MTKRISDRVKDQLKVGDIVAFNDTKDAIWFEIIERDGYRIWVRERGTNYAKQLSDVSLVAQVLDKYSQKDY